MRINVDNRLGGALALPTRKLTVDSVRLLLPLLADVDGAIEYGFRGGHQQLARTLATATDEDDLDVLGEAVSRISATLPPGLSFPMERSLDDRIPGPPLELHLSHMLPSSSANGRLSALTRMVPSSIHKLRSQEDVGQLLWPAAPVLARWLAAHPSLVAGRHVLEIGAGMGLTGFAAGLIGAASELASGVPAIRTRVVVTDFNAVVLHNLRYNATLNEPTPLNAGHPSMSLLRALAMDGTAETAPAPHYSSLHSSHSVAGSLFTVYKLDWSLPAYVPACLPAKLLEYRRRRLQRFDHGKAEPSSSAGANGQGIVACDDGSASVSSSGAAGGDGAAAESAPGDTSSSASSSSPPLPLDALFDVILGSDMVCCVEDAFCVAGTLARHLAKPGALAPEHPGGRAYFLLPPPDVRWGIEAWEDALSAVGLLFEEQPVPQQFLEHPPPELAPLPEHEALHRLHLYEPPKAAGADAPADTVAEDKDKAAPSAAPELVVAGGYEARLRLFTVRWPDGPAAPAAGAAAAAASCGCA